MPYESFQGGPNAKFEGTLYFPKSQIQFAGNPTVSMAHYTIIVALQFQVVGNSSFNNDYSALQGGSPIQQVGLVEWWNSSGPCRRGSLYSVSISTGAWIATAL